MILQTSPVDVPEEQPYNPFTEVQILLHHRNIVRTLLVLDYIR